jgi:hypothetical protein
MDGSKILDIVIVNWNSGCQLAECVDSIDRYSSDFINKIIIIDNGSVDDSAQRLPVLSRLTTVFVGENLGFGKACNLGAAQTNGEFLLFLNPDAALLPRSLHETIAYMQESKHTKVGICGIQLLDETNQVARSCARFPSPAGFVAHAFGLVRLFPQLGHFMAEWAHDQTRKVDQVIGAFFFVRRNVFEQLGGFDERFFVYFEEVDFSYRARQAGWRSVFLAQAQAFHAGGGTSNQIKARRLFYSLRSRLLYAFKHFSVPGAMLVLLTTLFVEPFTRTTFGLLRRSWPTVKETWSGYGMLWRWLPQWIFNGVTR